MRECEGVIVRSLRTTVISSGHFDFTVKLQCLDKVFSPWALSLAASFVHPLTFLSADAFLTYESERDFPWTSDGRSSDNVFSNNVVSNTERAIGFKNGDRNVVIGEMIYGQIFLLKENMYDYI